MSERLKRFLSSLPLHIIVIAMAVIWLLPTLGLLVTSLRPVQDANTSGWWTVFSAPAAGVEYVEYCASCHGPEGDAIAAADFSNPEYVALFRRSVQLAATFNNTLPDGSIHVPEDQRPDAQQLADILTQIRGFAGVEERPRFTLSNYVDALVGYRGQTSYEQDCAAGTQSSELTCDFVTDLGNSRGMARAFLNTLIVTIPATLLPLIFAALAAYAFSWLHFPGRMWLFALLVGLQIVPLQMTLVPISKLYQQLGLSSSFFGVWLFHTGFGLPYAIFLMRNFIGSLPRDLFESAYLDGASHWTAFTRLALPLSMPALASLAIFQFLWVWNDLLVALVFLSGRQPVLTYQINGLVQSLGGGWHLLTASAFLSMLLPMLVFFAFQRFFVRGLLSGAVKG
ncbi:MAG TPA: carbohydrate ABC transporter permease [Anaerolineales bacterium]|nr:carbohydrate ABC transporter permease [Anaerolineales bacterium]HRQ93004.1 carbohydrate ABC transporter permease [Anaerolineales bacterium]